MSSLSDTIDGRQANPVLVLDKDQFRQELSTSRPEKGPCGRMPLAERPPPPQKILGYLV
jgi:hypothetical protein